MATALVRFKAHCDAVTGTDTPLALMTRYAEAKCAAFGVLHEYEAAETQNDKAKIVMRVLLQQAKNDLKSHERGPAQAAAIVQIDADIEAALPDPNV